MRAVIEEATAEAPARGAQGLTERQHEILGLVRLGMPNKRIGRILGISEATVRKHLDRTAAVAVAFADRTRDQRTRDESTLTG